MVTSFEFDLHPFGPLLHRGALVFPGSQAPEVWQVFGEFAAAAPDHASMMIVAGRADPATGDPESLAGEPIVVIAYNHSGDAGTVERDLAPLRSGPEPVSITAASYPLPGGPDGERPRDGLAVARTSRAATRMTSAPTSWTRSGARRRRAPTGAPFGDGAGGAISRVAEEPPAFPGREAEIRDQR